LLSRTTISIDTALLKRARHCAINEDINLSKLVEKLLREYLENTTKKDQA
jgi:metal-responsive CopG/Arc/MetJ family transcriptional regulator